MNLNKIKINWVYAFKPPEEVSPVRYLLCVDNNGRLIYRLWRDERLYRNNPLQAEFKHSDNYTPGDILKKHEILSALGVMTLAEYLVMNTDFEEKDILEGKVPESIRKFLWYSGFFGDEGDINGDIYEFDDKYYESSAENDME